MPSEISDSLDLDFDPDWITGTAKLRSIGIEMILHPNIRYKDNGIDDSFLQFAPDPGCGFIAGVCHLKYNEKVDLYDVQIVRKTGLDKTQTEFIRGHEEGHAMLFLGQMSKLYQEAQKLGLSFDFFSQCDSQRNDESVNRFMNGVGLEGDEAIFWEKNYIPKERIADVGGLIGLIKSRADHNLISKLTLYLKGIIR